MLTEIKMSISKKDLALSTSSIWMETKLPTYNTLDKDIDVDVCIVGSGIAGLTCAYLLSAHKTVALIDMGEIGMGETSRTTAHITNVIDDRYSEIERLHGENAAGLAADSQTEAINSIERFIKKDNIECDFRRLNGYLFFKPDEQKLYDSEYEAAKRAGIKVVKENVSPLGCFKNDLVLKFPDQGEFNIFKYLNGLLRSAEKNGCAVYTGTKVIEIADGDVVKIMTEQGHTITAKDVIVATNTPISDYLSVNFKQAAYRTYVVCYELPKDNDIPEALFWDTESPYHYIRKYVSNGKEYLIVGGEDHKTGQEDEAEDRFENLDKWSKEKFNDLSNAAYKWSGQVFEPADGLSLTGKDPENPEHVYIITGDSGMGITHGTYSALILNDLISGRKNPWSEIYDPKRITLKAAPEYIKEGVNAAIQFTDYITPGDVSDVSEIKNSDGRIIRHGLDKVAVYKDEKGTVYKMSALCTHLKCIVSWNETEKTWDCPCHGSRFSATGKVITGPAIADLPEYEGEV
ncbi:MAG: FAD-dependent oxidoreductase [bacterium]|nr:FAD-dependent oxidoreductase [bacterium]